MADPFVAEIRIVPFNFAPTGWAFCDGTLLPIMQNTALFSLLGTFYGGDGRSTFALPDLRGRAPLFMGQGPGLSNYDLGQNGGQAAVTLIQSELPLHNHQVRANSGVASVDTPVNNVWASGARGRPLVYATSANTTSLQAFAMAGQSQPHNNRQPFLCLNFIIALQGVFPPRG